ncbi:MAG: FecR family protein [Bacteroidota bacterium]
MEKEQLKELFKKYHEGKCTEEEKALLEAWYLQFNEHDLDITPGRIKAIGKRIFRELPGNHMEVIKIGLKLLAAAIAFGAIIAITLKLSLPQDKSPKLSNTHDIDPGTNEAVLTLSNGKKINLSNAVAGQLVSQSGIRILKTTSGQIIYKFMPDAGHSAENSNNITTPNGGQWQLILPEGTKVWLNSLSSLTYPATLGKQKSRIVQLNGEAYFEVAKDKLHPFIVRTGQQEVEVLGTHFNINSYPDEPSVKTTLAEGRVKVSLTGGGKSKFLMPGQQAILMNADLKVSDANIEEALAWKNGYFRFNDESIQSVMRKLSRWYNIDVQYEGDIPDEGLNGKVSRFRNISQVLKALEATKTIHFKVEGRRITVLK